MSPWSSRNINHSLVFPSFDTAILIEGLRHHNITARCQPTRASVDRHLTMPPIPTTPFVRHLQYFSLPSSSSLTLSSSLNASLSLGLNLPLSFFLALSLRLLYSNFPYLSPINTAQIPRSLQRSQLETSRSHSSRTASQRYSDCTSRKQRRRRSVR